MPLAFIFDEHLRGGLWQAIRSHNSLGVYPLDVVRVGDLPDLPLGSKDSDILTWAQVRGRILVSRDESTMKTHFQDHLHQGQTLPGLFIIRRRTTLPHVVSFLVAATYASEPDDWR